MPLGEGVWVYAVTTDRAALTGSTEIRGVAGESLRTVTEVGYAAVVGSVDLDEFGEQALRRNLEDLDWLSQVARRHDAVVAAVCTTGPTVPLRLATVYFDDERVRTMLHEQAAAFGEALDRIAGRAEWGVRAFSDLGAPSNATKHSGKRSGTEYLMQRRAQVKARKDAESLAAEQADSIYAELARGAAASIRQPLSQSTLSPRHGSEILNATFLVDDRRSREFVAVVEAVDARADDIDIVLTGPWAPYSFTAVEAQA